MSRPRHLVGTRRTVSAAERAEYDALWAALHREATALGAHAWRFVGAGDEASLLEFLEFASGSDPRASPSVAAALTDLERRFRGDADEWRELPDPAPHD